MEVILDELRKSDVDVDICEQFWSSYGLFDVGLFDEHSWR